MPFVPSKDEREAIIQESSKMVRDLRCTLSIDMSRADLAAMTVTEAWQAPPQPATCDVVTSKGSHVATFSLTPEITLINGNAIGVKLNADDFEGTPPMIGKALQSYINFNAAFQDRLMDVVNEHLATWLGTSTRDGQILLDAAPALVGREIALTGIGSIDPKGFTAPVLAYSVADVMALMASPAHQAASSSQAAASAVAMEKARP